MKNTWRFIKYIYDHFWEIDGSYTAATLSFTTLFALVPMIAVMISVLTRIPKIQSLRQPVQDFIFQHFVPVTGQSISQYLDQFSQKATLLSPMSIAFIVLSAIFLLVTIEHAFNRTWHVPQRRHNVYAFFLYSVVLIVVPILMAGSFAISSYINTLLILQNNKIIDAVIYNSWGLSWLPVMFETLSFTLLYFLIPNCRVRLIHALYGGLFATVLFEIAKWTYSFYLSQYNTYEFLYGAFSIVPLFFLWIYWAWVIVLLGAEVAYAVNQTDKFMAKS